jgi:hypothetical protein
VLPESHVLYEPKLQAPNLIDYFFGFRYRVSGVRSALVETFTDPLAALNLQAIG